MMNPLRRVLALAIALAVVAAPAAEAARRIAFPKAAAVKYSAVGNKYGALGGNNATGFVGDASHASATSRISARTPNTAVSFVSVAFCNWSITPSGETNGANAVTVKAGLELSGTAYPFYFTGSPTKVLQPGDTVWSDLLSVTVPANTQYFVRPYISVTAGQTWPVSRALSVSNGEGSNYSSSISPGSDLSYSTGVISGSGTSGYGYGPCGMRGTPAGSLGTVYVAGNSIAVGAGEIGAGTFGDIDGYTSYIERGLGANVHWMTATRSSSTTASFNSFSPLRIALATGTTFTHAVTEYGTNDVYGSGLTFAQTTTALITSWNRLLLVAPKVIQTTITPRTTSTDGWITTVNQTIVAPPNNAVRTAVNDWLRDRAPMVSGVAVATGTTGAGVLRAGDVGHPLFKVWDIALLAETSLNSGIWKSSGGAWVFDGIHPSVLGDTNLQAGIILADLVP